MIFHCVYVSHMRCFLAKSSLILECTSADSIPKTHRILEPRVPWLTAITVATGVDSHAIGKSGRRQ